MAKIYRNKLGEKLYPVCDWERNQHKIYNAYDRAWLRCEEEEHSDEAEEELARVNQALNAFDAHVIGRLVYATYEDSCIIKDLIAAYDCRGDMIGHWKEYSC